MAFWIFKCDPKVYDLDLRLSNPDPVLTWNVTQYRKCIQPGDISFLWRTRRDRGIRGAMRIDQAPQEVEETTGEVPFYDDPSSDEGRRIIKKPWRVFGTIICRNMTLDATKLKSELGLQELSAFRPVPATVFPVTEDEGNIICSLLGLNL